MLDIIAVLLVIGWLAGTVTSNTMGGFVHVLLVIAIITVLIRVIRGAPRHLMGFLKNPVRILGILFAGTYGLAYHGLTYTKKTHTANLGGVHLSLDQKERVHIPQWVAVSGIALGAGLLLHSRRA